MRRHGLGPAAARAVGEEPDRRAAHLLPITGRSRGEGWDRTKPQTPETAREWVRFAAKKGIDGLKLGAHDPEIMAALLDEAKKLGLGSTAHLDQMGVVRMNALQASRLGLGAMTHYYGLFESLLKDNSIQPYPVTQNYNDEQHRFGQVARLWDKIHPRGSEPWNALIKEWVDRRFVIDPTMTIYSAGRDVMRMRNADWHDKYTAAVAVGLLSAEPRRARLLLVRLDDGRRDGVEELLPACGCRSCNDYKNAGGRVTTGSDSGFIYQTYGFGYILELEMLQEAGFHPLEVDSLGDALRRRGAPRAEGQEPSTSASCASGLKADLVITKENPLQNFKTLYGTGAVRINDATNKPERVGGIDFVVKDGIVYDAKKLLADVAAKVEKAKGGRSDHDGRAGVGSQIENRCEDLSEARAGARRDRRSSRRAPDRLSLHDVSERAAGRKHHRASRRRRRWPAASTCPSTSVAASTAMPITTLTKYAAPVLPDSLGRGGESSVIRTPRFVRS